MARRPEILFFKVAIGELTGQTDLRLFMPATLQVLFALAVLGIGSSLTAAEPPATIWEAAGQNDVPAVHSFVRSGISPNIPDAAGLTPLMHAAIKGHEDALRNLLQMGADPRLTTPGGLTALGMLLRRPTDPDARTALLMQAYAILRQQARPPAGRPARPESVAFFEPRTGQPWLRSDLTLIMRQASRQTAQPAWLSQSVPNEKPIAEMIRLANEGARMVRGFTSFRQPIRAQMLESAVARGRRLSDQIRASGTGIVYLDPDADSRITQEEIDQLAHAYSKAESSSRRPESAPQTGWLRSDLYFATLTWALLLAYENPEVLFVVPPAEGNFVAELSLATLARIMPNVVCLAAVDGKGALWGGNDNGWTDFEISALAAADSPTRSHALSTAASSLTGAAAYVRHAQPGIPVAELKALMLRTIAEDGRFDGKLLTEFTATNVRERAAAYTEAAHQKLKLYFNLRFMERDVRRFTNPVKAAAFKLDDVDWLSRMAVETDPKSAYAWHLRSRYLQETGHLAEAESAALKALRLLESRVSWNQFGDVQVAMGKFGWAVVAYDQALQRWESEMKRAPKGTAPDLLGKALLLASRADAYFRVGNQAMAKADGLAARQLDAKVLLSDQLTALLEKH